MSYTRGRHGRVAARVGGDPLGTVRPVTSSLAALVLGVAGSVVPVRRCRPRWWSRRSPPSRSPSAWCRRRHSATRRPRSPRRCVPPRRGAAGRGARRPRLLRRSRRARRRWPPPPARAVASRSGGDGAVQPRRSGRPADAVVCPHRGSPRRRPGGPGVHPGPHGVARIDRAAGLEPHEPRRRRADRRRGRRLPAPRRAAAIVATAVGWFAYRVAFPTAAGERRPATPSTPRPFAPASLSS